MSTYRQSIPQADTLIGLCVQWGILSENLLLQIL